MKTAPRFTKEPWVLSITERYAYVRSAIGEYIMQYSFGTVSKAIKAERIANARLISAAPDLLAACQTFAEWLRREEAGSLGQPWADKRNTPEGEAAWHEWFYENIRLCDLAQTQARAAIAKATGEK